MMKWEAAGWTGKEGRKGKGKGKGGDERALSACCQNSSPFQTFFKGNTTLAQSPSSSTSSDLAIS